MRKLFLFVAVAALSFSCSKDDDNNNPSDSIKMKVNGIQTTITDIEVDEQPEEDGEVFLSITGTIGSGTDMREIFMEVYEGDTGTDMFLGFSYSSANPPNVYFGGDNFNTNITTNSSSRLKGTFSGTMTSFDGSESITITEGTFDVSH